jgi:hypothetical protein
VVVMSGRKQNFSCGPKTIDQGSGLMENHHQKNQDYPIREKSTRPRHVGDWIGAGQVFSSIDADFIIRMAQDEKS